MVLTSSSCNLGINYFDSEQVPKFFFFLSYLAFGVSAGKRDQINKKIFFKVINILDQMIKSTSILLRNFFLKKISIWSLFPALTPFMFNDGLLTKTACGHPNKTNTC